jgi:type IV secretory pathway VirB10-like protein
VRIRGPLRRFGNPHPRRQVFVPVPVFYSLYGDESYPSVADPSVPETQADPASAAQGTADQNQVAAARNDDELRAAYLQGARDALTHQDDSRYGEHYMDSREHSRQQAAAEPKKPERKSTPDEEPAAAPVEEKLPATVFIFKDGHQLETRNYAIMSGTLFDFSGKMLKKIQMDEIDSAATVKANDDRGVVVKLN